MRFDSDSSGIVGSVARFLVNLQAWAGFTTVEIVVLVAVILMVVL